MNVRNSPLISRVFCLRISKISSFGRSGALKNSRNSPDRSKSEA